MPAPDDSPPSIAVMVVTLSACGDRRDVRYDTEYADNVVCASIDPHATVPNTKIHRPST